MSTSYQGKPADTEMYLGDPPGYWLDPNADHPWGLGEGPASPMQAAAVSIDPAMLSVPDNGAYLGAPDEVADYLADGPIDAEMSDLSISEDTSLHQTGPAPSLDLRVRDIVSAQWETIRKNAWSYSATPNHRDTWLNRKTRYTNRVLIGLEARISADTSLEISDDEIHEEMDKVTFELRVQSIVNSHWTEVMKDAWGSKAEPGPGGWNMRKTRYTREVTSILEARRDRAGSVPPITDDEIRKEMGRVTASYQLAGDSRARRPDRYD